MLWKGERSNVLYFFRQIQKFEVRPDCHWLLGKQWYISANLTTYSGKTLYVLLNLVSIASDLITRLTFYKPCYRNVFKWVLCTQLTSFIRSYDLVTFKSSGNKRVYLINKHHYESTEVTMINFKYAVIYISVIPCVLAKEILKKMWILQRYYNVPNIAGLDAALQLLEGQWRDQQASSHSCQISSLLVEQWTFANICTT